MKKIKIMLLILMLSTIAFGAKSDYFTSVGNLKKNLKSDNLLILDARGSKASYLKGHIPGAVLVSWQEFSKMDGKASDQNWGILQDKNALQEKFREKGISNDKEIVVYADTLNGWGEDGRILWMLKYAGVKNVKILDGGIKNWEATESVAHFSTKPKKSNFVINEFNKNMIIETKELSGSLAKNNVLDSRETNEYNGEKNFGEAKLGRIPTSKSTPFKTLLDENGKVKSKEEVAKILKSVNYDVNKPFVAYCTCGIRSAEIWAILTAYGYEGVNYDASFSGWASTEGLEVVK